MIAGEAKRRNDCGRQFDRAGRKTRVSAGDSCVSGAAEITDIAFSFTKIGEQENAAPPRRIFGKNTPKVKELSVL
jgi:hypothetical protein